MTVATSPTYTGPGQSIYEQHQTLILCLLAIAAGLDCFSESFHRPMSGLKPGCLPIKQWISDLFRWLDKTATFALFHGEGIYTGNLLGAETTAHLVGVSALERGQSPSHAAHHLDGDCSCRRHSSSPVGYNGKIGLNVAIAILAVVSLDGLPFILASLSKAIKASPDTALYW